MTGMRPGCGEVEVGGYCWVRLFRVKGPKHLWLFLDRALRGLGSGYLTTEAWKATEKGHSQDWLCHNFGAEKNLPKCDIVRLATLNCLISDGCYATLPVFDFSRFEAA
jgi:hypothetical protein